MRFSLNDTTYQNNSIVTLDYIGEKDDVLSCITNLTACCRGQDSFISGNWLFPNETRVPSKGALWDFYRTRAQKMVLLRRRRGGVAGIYRCEIPDSMKVTQTLYIGVYTASTGECQCFSNLLLCLCCNKEEIELTKV